MPTTQEISLNPQSAVGDILSSNGSSRIRVPLGTSLQVLSAQSSTSSGLQWITPPASQSNYSLISSGELTANAQSLSLSNLPGDTIGGIGTGTDPFYSWYRLEISIPSSTTAGISSAPYLIFNNNATTGGGYMQFLWEYYGYAAINEGYSFFVLSWYGKDDNMFWNYTIDIPNIGNNSYLQAITRSTCGFSGGNEGYSAETHYSTNFGRLSSAVRIDSLSGANLLKAGTKMALYGIKGAQY